MERVYLTIVLAPLIAAAIAGLFGRQVGRRGAHFITIAGVTVSFVLSLYVLSGLAFGYGNPFNGPVYEWATVGGISMEVGFLIDRLTAVMMTVVTFVSLAVHVYRWRSNSADPTSR